MYSETMMVCGLRNVQHGGVSSLKFTLLSIVSLIKNKHLKRMQTSA